MATTRLSRPVSLSLALHGALILALLALGTERHTADQAQALHVVWLEGGLPDLAATLHGDEGLVAVAESDPAAVPVPDASPVDPDEDHAPAPANLEAENPVAAADRPAPAPGDEPSDMPAQTTTESSVGQPPIEAADSVAEAPLEEEPVDAEAVADAPIPEELDADPPIPEELVADPSIPEELVADPPVPEELVADAPTTEEHVANEPLAEAVDDPEQIREPDAGNLELEVPQPLEARADIVPGREVPAGAPALPGEGTPPPERTSEAPAMPPSQPLAAAEQQRMREDILDRLHRSRDLASRASLAWSRDGREYRAELTRVPAAGSTGIEEAVLEIEASLDGRQVSTEVRLKRLAFSHYAQLIDRWDPSVQIHDDVIEGRFHSNSEILIENSGGTQPVFHGQVTTAGGVDTSRSSRRVRRDEVFLGGLDTRSARIPLPRRFAPLEALGPDGSDDAEVISLATDTHVTFRADGSYRLEPMQGSGTRTGTLSATQTYFVAADKTKVGVKGVLNGKVLVYSPRGIVIEGDLVYAADPARGAAADDYLGLVSDGTIEVAEPGVTGEGDLTIHAAIYARGRFAVRRFSRGDRATLTIYGSLSAGSLSATEPRFRTKLLFDRRLEESRPPSFPLTNRYEIASWDGVWRSDTD